MKTTILSLLWTLTFFGGDGIVWSAEFPTFEYHEIARIGNHMGQTTLVDVDKDGKLDWVVGCSHGDIWWFQYQSPDRWIRHLIGNKVGTEVGGTAFDVDGDGWVDQVSGSTWFRNPGHPAGKEWTKYAIGAITNSHDVVAADIDGDGRLEVVMMQDTKGLFWYKIPSDPTKTWESHLIGPAVHAGIAPHGVGEINGDGKPDIVCSTGWFENVDGKGGQWKWHGNIDGGHGGKFKNATRVWVVDLDKDGYLDVFSGEGPMGGTGLGGKRRWFIWENVDGRGLTWKEHIILEGPECHEGVAGDVDGDGDLDICSKPWNGDLHIYLRNMLVEHGGKTVRTQSSR